MTNITTENLVIESETCKRLDKLVYGNNPTVFAMTKHGVYKDELINLIAKHDLELSKKLSNNGLYYVFCFAERVVNVSGKNNQERRSANIETAHNQLKNYK